MDRVQILLLGFPIFLFCSDLANLFSFAPPPPSRPAARHHHPHPHHHDPVPSLQQAPDFPAATQNSQTGAVGSVGYGTTVELKFCASCSYRGNAVTMKKMLETSFPGIDVILSNYPPALPKRLLGKVVPVAQVGVIGIIMAGEQIFPRLGIMTPPPWYFSMRANRFGTIATTWLLGNFVQSFLQSSGAFEVYFNGDLVFSKLKEQRFPGEFELKKLIGDRLPDSTFGANLGRVWS